MSYTSPRKGNATRSGAPHDHEAATMIENEVVESTNTREALTSSPFLPVFASPYLAGHAVSPT